MKLILMVALTAVAVADKLPETVPVVAILRSQQVNPDELGAHSSDFEADNGIKVQLSGSEGAAGGSNMAGSWSYPQEDGSIASVKFVADENGYQPQSDLLPVAPGFPHPIPQFVLD
ncbi:cuticle protein AMP4-like isoform X2 [Procambarus clarkii]|uniref:cuticle protein AMP4-like isoform X2 n=1 Tax=Procambarus clarkii TaxID=6728 RepID=UPI001E673A1C|nr:cuticle protein AMP4-like [Procambarus clarkii]